MEKPLAKSVLLCVFLSGSEANMAKSKYLTKPCVEGKFVILFSILCMLVYMGLGPWSTGFFLCFFPPAPFSVLKFHSFFDI